MFHHEYHVVDDVFISKGKDVDFDCIDEFARLERESLQSLSLEMEYGKEISTACGTDTTHTAPAPSRGGENSAEWSTSHNRLSCNNKCTPLDDLAEPLEPRFSLFNTTNERTIHAHSISELLKNRPASSAFESGSHPWWLDCMAVTNKELSMLSQAFAIHPLTTEDILVQEEREKFEVFDNYYFVSFHTLMPEEDGEFVAEPLQFYMVVFQTGILTFHNSPLVHPANVRRRVRQLRKYFEVDTNWLCYALIDNIIDSFEPFMSRIDNEVDEVEDLVFVDTRCNSKAMFLRIASSREKVMTLAHELADKNLVIRGLSRFCQWGIKGSSSPNNLGKDMGPRTSLLQADIAMYLDDIQDHIVTMARNLKLYERILSNSYYNYSAQLQTEKRSNTNRATLLMQLVTVLGTLIFPMQFATGLFSMNIPVPGSHIEGSYRQWFVILGLSMLILIVTFTTAKVFIARRYRVPHEEKSLRMRKFRQLKQKFETKSILSYHPGDNASDIV